jgi:hypothetical protein
LGHFILSIIFVSKVEKKYSACVGIPQVIEPRI